MVHNDMRISGVRASGTGARSASTVDSPAPLLKDRARRRAGGPGRSSGRRAPGNRTIAAAVEDRLVVVTAHQPLFRQVYPRRAPRTEGRHGPEPMSAAVWWFPDYTTPEAWR